MICPQCSSNNRDGAVLRRMRLFLTEAKVEVRKTTSSRARGGRFSPRRLRRRCPRARRRCGACASGCGRKYVRRGSS